MKLLFDQNLSPRLAARLIDPFSDSIYVSSVSLDTAEDVQVWNCARANGFVIVSSGMVVGTSIVPKENGGVSALRKLRVNQ